MNIDFENVVESASKRLRDHAKKIEGVSPNAEPIQCNIQCAEFSTEIANARLATLRTGLSGKRHSIYVFELEQGNLDSGAVLEAYCAAKASKAGGRAFARVNLPNENNSKFLYIGSSANTLTRMKQHFGLGSKQTYAMHLLEWVNRLPRKIILTIYVFDAVHQEKLHLIEEYMWAKYKPLLGRSGSV